MPPDGEAATELMFQRRGKLRIRHHGSAESAEQKETREDTEAELVERSRGESDRHHRKDAKKGWPHKISGRGPGEARDETSHEQENCITKGQASYSADPRIDSACTRKWAGEGHLYQRGVAGPRNAGTSGRASESTGPCPESACTIRQTGGRTHQQSVADTGRPETAQGVLLRLL